MENSDIIFIESIDTLKKDFELEKVEINKINTINKSNIEDLKISNKRNNNLLKDILQLIENQNDIISNLEKNISKLNNTNQILSNKVESLEKKNILREKDRSSQILINKNIKNNNINTNNIIDSLKDKVYILEKKLDILFEKKNKNKYYDTLNFDPSFCRKCK